VIFINITWQSKYRISHKATLHISWTNQWIAILLFIIIDLIFFFYQKSSISRFSCSNYKISFFELRWLRLYSLLVIKRNVFYVLKYNFLLSIDDFLITVKFSKVLRIFFLRFWEYEGNMSCFSWLLRSAYFIDFILLSDEEFVWNLSFLMLEFLLILSSF